MESRPGGESSTQGVSLFVFGIRYIDDIVMRQRDANASGPPEERRYYLTDANYNVSMIVTDSGWGVERVFYTAYGEPEVFPFGDADGDYQVHPTIDLAAITAIKDGQAPYNILADLNLDGAVTQADLNAFSAYSNALGGRGVLTASNGSATTGNDIGYAGYTWNDERSQWHVRHREYHPKLGRWLQRDPAGYAEGLNVYEFSSARPAQTNDAFGLMSDSGPGEEGRAACRDACASAFDPKTDPTGYVRCMAGCINGLRGLDCKTYCARWTDPEERAACDAGCDAAQGREGGGCMVECGSDNGPPVILAGACVAIITPEPLSTVGGLVVGAIACGCFVYTIINTEKIVREIPRVRPLDLPRRRLEPKKDCYCKCIKAPGFGPDPQGYMTRSACYSLPYKKTQYSYCYCEGDP